MNATFTAGFNYPTLGVTVSTVTTKEQNHNLHERQS